MIIIVALALLLVAALAVAVFLFLKTRHFKADNMQLRAVVENQENYIFLINRLFEVKETNVKAPEGQPMLLGNVLHCRNAEETARTKQDIEAVIGIVSHALQILQAANGSTPPALRNPQ